MFDENEIGLYSKAGQTYCLLEPHMIIFKSLVAINRPVLDDAGVTRELRTLLKII
jgi:hypothetical protein